MRSPSGSCRVLRRLRSLEVICGRRRVSGLRLLDRAAAVRAEPLPPIRAFLLDLGVQLLERLPHRAEPPGLLRLEVRLLLRVGLKVVEFEVGEILRREQLPVAV